MKEKKIILACLLFISFIYQSCIAQQHKECSLIKDESGRFTLKNFDSICNSLKELSPKGLRLFFYIKDELPQHSEKDKIAYSFFREKRDDKAASVFISFPTKKFTILYSDSLLYGEDYLVEREMFGEYISEFLKSDSSDYIFEATIKRFENLFSGERKFFLKSTRCQFLLSWIVFMK